jgi:DNA polymerase I-like protein with 3'-5' exonuclease and polymerase domains
MNTLSSTALPRQPRTHEYYQHNQFLESGAYSWQEFDSDPGQFWNATKDCRPFALKVPTSRDWNTAERRLLVVVSHVDTADLKSRKLMSAQGGIVLTNLLRYARERYIEITGVKRSFAVSVVNYNFFKTYHLSSEQQTQAADTCSTRIKDRIKELEPTHVLVVGDSAAEKLLADGKFAGYYRGWQHKLNVDGVKVRLVHTFDYSTCYNVGSNEEGDEDTDNDDGGDQDKAVDAANLLGMAARHMLTLWHNGLIWSMSDVKPNYKLVDTLERFDKFMNLLQAQPAFAVDLETRDLSVYDNKILVSQWSWDRKLAYIIPVEHPETPFNTKQIAYIKSKLRAFLGQRITYKRSKPRYIVGHNLSFDTRVFRQELELPLIHWPIFDTMSGFYCVDENTKSMRRFAQTEYQGYGSLAMQCCHYGNDFYIAKEGFSKEDRGNIESQSLSDVTFLEYCSFDSQGSWALHECQIEEASTQRMCNTSYGDHFLHFVLTQMNNNIHMFSHMEQRGSFIDLPYLLNMMRPDSPIKVAIVQQMKDINLLPEVKATNDLLVKEARLPSNGLFGKVNRWLFDLSKTDHKLKLFFDVLKLKPVVFGKPTAAYPEGQPGIGKAFQEVYKKKQPAVQALERIGKLQKLMNSYVISFYRKISESADGKRDSRLRPRFGFFDVVTGRGNSFSPSLQQIPTRTAEAKYIKRMFCAKPRQLMIKLDFSAHEVRGWCISAGDSKLAKLFRAGRDLRLQFFKTFDPSLPQRIKIEGDLHRINVALFFSIDLKTVAMDVLEALRDAVKAIVFGSIYGRSVGSIAKSINKDKKETQIIYDKFFDTYRVAKRWLEWAVSTSITYLHTHSIFGRKRNLFGYLSGVEMLMAAMDRRGMNSPIQGLGADIAHTSARLFTLHLEKVCLDLKIVEPGYREPITGVEVMVHDSTRFCVDYEYVLLCMQLASWCYTTGAELYYKEHFGTDFTCPLEIEFELGFDESATRKFNWAIIEPGELNKIETSVKAWMRKDNASYNRLATEVVDDLKKKAKADNKEYVEVSDKVLTQLAVKRGVAAVYDNSLCSIIRKALEDQKAKQSPELDVDEAFAEVYTNWKTGKVKKYMDQNYPWFDLAENYD